MWGQRRVELANGYVKIRHEDFPGDWVRGTNRLIMHCRIHLGDAVYETADDWTIRYYNPWHLSVLVKSLSDWSLVGFFSWRDLSRDIAAEEHYFMVVGAS